MSTLIVGAGPGLGAALARRFATAGPVGLIARDAGRLDRLAGDLGREGIACATAQADAGDPEALGAALEDLIHRLGPPATLIYNAARMTPGTADDLDPARLVAEFETNLVGAHVAAQAVLPAMQARGRGALLFTGGGLALEPYPEWTSLALGKAALRSYALSLHKHLAPEGIHVAVVAICGIVAPGGPFDPDRIAGEYWRLATAPRGTADREAIWQPAGTDPFYNDPDRRYAATSLPPAHAADTAEPAA